MKRTILATLAGTAAAAGLATAAFAQPAPPPPGPGPGAERGARIEARMEQRRAGRLKALHDALQLRPDQEGAWRAFTDAAHPPADLAQRMRRRHEARAEMTTPQRLDEMAQRMAERQAEFQKRADATKRFYAALNPAQQKTFDALSRMQGPRGPGARGRFGPGGPGMAPPPQG